MSEGPDLVSLLYRADWTRLSLSADVHTSLDRDRFQPQLADGTPDGPPSRLVFRSPRGPLPGLAPLADSVGSAGAAGSGEPAGSAGPRPPREPGTEWAEATEVLGTETERSTLLVAPGRRYRQQGEGTLRGSDGQRGWHAVEENGSWTVTGTGDPEPPLEELLWPAWLLVAFTLEITGRVTVDGRDALRVTATPRLGLWEWPAPSDTGPSDTGPSDTGPSDTGPSDTGPSKTAPSETGLSNRRELVVDTELGILLRHEETRAGKPLRVTELTGVRVGLAPPSDDAWDRPPGGWASVDKSTSRDELRWPKPSGIGGETFKLVAGLAAGGIGAVIRSSRSSGSRSFEQATREEPEAGMPAFEGPLPADGPPPSDELLHLIHAGRDRWGQGITATLHEWDDAPAMLGLVPDGARRAGFGGLGLLVDAAVDAAGPRFADTHSVSRLYLNRSGQYRIEPVSQPRSGKRLPQTVICDGERRWRIGEQKAFAGPAAPPQDFPNLFDASWLLAYQLAGGAEILTGGRSGRRLKVGAGYRPLFGWFIPLPDEVVVDGELGIVLRWISLARERPTIWWELRDVVAGPVDPGLFRPDIPPGVPVTEVTSMGVPVTEETSDEPPRPGGWAQEPGSLPGKIASWLGRQTGR